METKFIIFLIVILMLFLSCTFILNPLKFLLKFSINVAVGICFILIANHFLDSTGLYIGINQFTSLFVGALGIPGLICLYILRIIL